VHWVWYRCVVTAPLPRQSRAPPARSASSAARRCPRASAPCPTPPSHIRSPTLASTTAHEGCRCVRRATGLVKSRQTKPTGRAATGQCGQAGKRCRSPSRYGQVDAEARGAPQCTQAPTCCQRTLACDSCKAWSSASSGAARQCSVYGR